MSFSFNISDTPVVSNETAGVAFDVPFSSFTYFLGGMSVAAPTTEFRIRFFVTDANGLLSVILQDTTTPPNGDPQVGFVFHGAQAFSGTTNSPTILANSYAASSGTFYSGGQPRDDLSGVIVDVTPVGSVLPEVPEPANLGIIAGACCLLITIRYRRRVN